MIGEIGMSAEASADELKVLRAAARAQAVTGLALTIHPGRHRDAPFQHLDVVDAAGGDVGRTIIAHVERTLFEAEDQLRLAATGCYLSFDLFGRESSYHPMAPIDMPNDAMRLKAIQNLMNAGHLSKVLLSQDICYRTHLRTYGGEGYAHVLKNVVPVMWQKGFTHKDVDRLLVTNVAAALGRVPR
jgi:phosphotriesterase-related protein